MLGTASEPVLASCCHLGDKNPKAVLPSPEPELWAEGCTAPSKAGLAQGSWMLLLPIKKGSAGWRSCQVCKGEALSRV